MTTATPSSSDETIRSGIVLSDGGGNGLEHKTIIDATSRNASNMLFPKLFREMEGIRWIMEKDIPWDNFDANKLSDEQAITIKMNAITEWAALPATEMFLRDNRHDSDFSAFISIWFYEEQKHSLVLMEYLKRFRPDLVPTEDELHAIRFEFDAAPPLETLMLHFCGEIRLNHWYRRAAEWHTEPVIQSIYKKIAGDEARHGGAYLRYMKKALEKDPIRATQAFTKLGVLMAGRSGSKIHPTTLEVSKSQPKNTILSRVSDPTWHEKWLNEQIQFDDKWEGKVSSMILKNLGILFDKTFKSSNELNVFRKTLPKESK